jgi:hypothetical protein
MSGLRKSSVASGRRGSVDVKADNALATMGYQSELPRNLSMLSVLGMYVSPLLGLKRIKH